MAVSDTSQDPALHHLNGDFHLGLVFGFAHPGGNDHRVIMVGHIQVCGIDIRFVKAGFADTGLQIVRHYDLCNPAKKGEGAAVGCNPVGQRLAPGGFRIRVVGGTQHGHKDLSLTHLSGPKIINVHGFSGIIDK